MRKYVRHPSCIPVEIIATMARNEAFFANADESHDSTRLCNISYGGFSCVVSRPLPLGCDVQLRIPTVWPDYSGHGSVRWCREMTDGFEVGIGFTSQDAFKAKMVEQLCQIEQYRQRAWIDEGRRIDSEQAAREWIALFAEEFSRSFQQPH